MKITEYSKVQSLSEDNVFLVDGTAGTKTIAATDLPFFLMDMWGPEMHRTIFRGKNLGNTFSSKQKAEIQNGTFKDLWLGDYWVINGINWRIVDIDYWYGTGSPVWNTHHLVIMPDTALYNSVMNDTSATTGGYVGSKMYISGLANAKSTITSAFGSNVLTHKEFLINAVTSGYPSAGAWYDSTVEIPSENMMMGTFAFAAANDGAGNTKCYTNSKTQLALMAVCPRFINVGTWLRDVVSSGHFSRIDTNGGITSSGAANSFGVRPVFAIG